VIGRADPKAGQRYTVNRYESGKATSADGTRRQVKVSLGPDNASFDSIMLTSDDEVSLKVVAELIQILR
jgi:hypothetical protein